MNTFLIEEFQLHYADKSFNTLRNYTKSIREFYEFMQEKRNCKTENEIIKATDWSCGQMYRNTLVGKGLNPKTVNNQMSGIRKFFNFLVLTNRINENPFLKVESVSTNSVEEYDRPYLEGVEFDKLIQTIQTKEPNKKQDNFELTSTRDALAVGIMLKAGLRVSELLSIKESDIDSNTGVVSILGKGGKLRKVKVGSDNLQRLNEYLYVRKTYSQSDYLFVSRYGTLISRQSMNKNLKSYLERASLNTEVSCHGLRKSSATNYLRNGVEVTKIAKMLGHSEIRTTLKHYAKESDDFDFID